MQSGHRFHLQVNKSSITSPSPRISLIRISYRAAQAVLSASVSFFPYQADPAPGHDRPVHHLALTLH
jgi:hypothetical protein